MSIVTGGQSLMLPAVTFTMATNPIGEFDKSESDSDQSPHTVEGGDERGRTLGPLDIYFMLSSDGGEPPSVAEFRTRFESIDLALTRNQREIIYSCISDSAPRGSIVSSKQFLAAWATMEQTFLRRAAAYAGVSNAQIAVALFSSLGCLGFFLGFLSIASRQTFVAVTIFNSVVQTALVTGSALAIVSARPRSKAESHLDDMDIFVSQIVLYTNSLAAEA